MSDCTVWVIGCARVLEKLQNDIYRDSYKTFFAHDKDHMSYFELTAVLDR